MKNLDKIINEARTSSKNQEPTTIHFEDGASCLLFKCELAGQITDGKYENSRPASHCNWLLHGDITCEIDGNTGYEGPSHRLRYDLSEWPGYIKKGGDWAWSERIIAYVAIGEAVDQSTLQRIVNDENKVEGIRMLAEQWQNAGNTTFKSINIPDYAKKYIDSVSEINNTSTYNKFKKSLSSINTNKLRGYLSSMEESVNTQL